MTTCRRLCWVFGWLVLVAGTTAGCGASGLHTRARVDLECEDEPLEERTLVDALYSGRTVAISGCGRTQTYTQVCSDVLQCAWVQ